MDINLNIFSRIFSETLSAESKNVIESFYLFGSLARGEEIQSGSDIDSVLVLKNKDVVDFDQISILSRDLILLDKKLGVEIDHVFVTQDDLFELLSPTLILNLNTDGVNVFGSDLKQRFSDYVKECPKSRMLNSFLRTDMFRRHQLRKRYLKIDLNNLTSLDEKVIFGLCKDTILTARDFLYFEKDILITPKKDICSYFLANVIDTDEYVNFPMFSYNVRYGVVKLETEESKLDFLKKSFDFMEKTSLLIQNKYKAVTGKTTLDIRPF